MSNRDSTTSSTRQGASSEPEPGGAPEQGDPFNAGLHDTPAKSWLSVALMVIGLAVVGFGVVMLDMSTMTASIVVMAVGVVIGLAGVVLGVKAKLMTNVE